MGHLPVDFLRNGPFSPAYGLACMPFNQVQSGAELAIADFRQVLEISQNDSRREDAEEDQEP